MATTAPYTTNQEKQKSKYVCLLYFMLSNLVIAFIYYFLLSGFVYPLIKNGEPMFSMPANLLLWLTFGFIVVLGVTNFFVLSLSKNTNRTGQRVTFVLYYIFFADVLLWALFTFTLKLPTAGVIILGTAICLGIYEAYRYLTRSIVAGVIYSLFILYLIYIFMQNLAYILL